MLLQHVLLYCLKGTLKGKGRGSVVPTRPFLVAKGMRKEEDDDSEDESPAKPMSSRPSKEIKSDDVMGLTPGAVAVFSQNLILQRLEEIKQLEGTYALLLDDDPAKKPRGRGEKKEKKEKKERKEERTTSRGSAASARQGDRKKSFDPSKGRMGGSSSDDDKGRGSLNRLEPPVKIPWSNEGPQGENWTRVDLIVDSGASDSTLPLGVFPGHEIGEARGYKEFSMADGRILPNLGAKKLQMAFQCGRVMTGTFSAVDTSKPLLSAGKLVSMGHKVEMNPNGKGSIILKDGGRITIYLRNGVWKIPLWIWDPFQGQDN